MNESYDVASDPLTEQDVNGNGERAWEESAAHMSHPPALPVPAIAKPPRINGLIYDAEIIKCIPDKKKKRDPKWQYCRDWSDFRGMGVACVCAYDMYERLPRIFTAGNWADFIKLIPEREEIIGFNSISFDDKLMKTIDVNIRTTYDLMAEAKLTAEAQHRLRYDPRRGGFSLKQLLLDNGLKAKPMDGAHAPMHWQMGNYGAVIDYCMHDVMLLHQLFQRKNRLYVSVLDATLKLPELRSMREAVKKQERADW